jgi:predicted enzyme related to lactoylglutathione lyase
MNMANSVVWVDIPVNDVERAMKFYGAMLNTTLERIPGMDGAVFPHSPDSVSGCLFKKPGEIPSANGALVYFNAQGRLDDAIQIAEANGGKIIQPKHSIGPYGNRAVLLDSEGNRIALHSM